MDCNKIASFIAAKRKERGLTQQQTAEKLNVTFQAVSKWENGTSYPNTELLLELSNLLGVTVDELLNGRELDKPGLTYGKAGVDILHTDAIKQEMSKFINLNEPRLLNGVGPFASLYDISFPEMANPVLVLKAEEPGSKQKLAMEYGYTESICHDMINHLVNDIAVMGAKPLAVLDTIVCGYAESETIRSIIRGLSEACFENECVLAGGETSVQPDVVDRGTYILTSCVAGILDKNSIIDGSSITETDVILALASNGLHTNGYSLVRLMMRETPRIKNDYICGIPFTEEIMKPHISYYKALKGLFNKNYVKGLAHITGGGIEGNLKRIIPEGLSAKIDLSQIKVLPIFKYLKANGNISDDEMLKVFNCGVGLICVVKKDAVENVINHIRPYHDCYEIGNIYSGIDKVEFINKLNFNFL